MTPIALLALLGIALLIPVFMDNDDEPETPEEPVEPVDPVDPVDPVEPVDPVVPTVVDGTASADTLVVESGQEVNGYSGEDTITAGADVTGATIDGGRDNDTISLAGTNNTADGYRGNDFFDIGGTGNSTSAARGTRPTVATAATLS